MTQPQRTEPLEDRELDRGPGREPPGEVGRPGWLVGRDEEIGPPGPGTPPEGREAWKDGGPRPPKSPETTDPPCPEGPVAWTAAASSVPRLSVLPRRERMDAAPEDPPGGPPGQLLPDEDGASSAEAVLEPASGDRGGATRSSPLPPHEPWWLVWGEMLAGNRTLQVALASVLVVATTVAVWPRHGEKVTTLSLVRRNPERFEGRLVRVRGEVGEVFEVGQGWVYALRDGADTVVVFSSLRRPSARDRVSVLATVSTGYLDGVPRVALFEASPGSGDPSRP